MQAMQKTKEVQIEDKVVEQMFEAGAHYGYGKSRRHPSVTPFICATKNKTDIIDLAQTKEMLEEAKKYVSSLGEKRKTILFVGTKAEAQNSIIDSAKSINMPYIKERWIGGIISNWGEIKKNIAELNDYNQAQKDGSIAKYTKKEKLVLSKKMEKLDRFYGGILEMKKAPDAIFIVDSKHDEIAKKEALQKNIPVIALLNSDSDISNIKCPIVANDSSLASIKFFAEEIASAYEEGLKKAEPLQTKE